MKPAWWAKAVDALRDSLDDAGLQSVQIKQDTESPTTAPALVALNYHLTHDLALASALRHSAAESALEAASQWVHYPPADAAPVVRAKRHGALDTLFRWADPSPV
jgi:hypothetical protein